MSRKKERKESIRSHWRMDAIISPSSSASSSLVPATILLEGGGGRTIDRHNPIIRDSRRIGKSLTPTSSPINPKFYIQEIQNYERNNKEIIELGHDHEFINPPTSSSRYLLDDSIFLPDTILDFDPVPTEKKMDDFSASSSSNQVVVLGVSLHCRGCESKVKKHISRMQGVKSFNIDFAAKKVTVIGDVTQLSVMATISKVKHAQISLPPLLDEGQ